MAKYIREILINDQYVLIEQDDNYKCDTWAGLKCRRGDIDLPHLKTTFSNKKMVEIRKTKDTTQRTTILWGK